MYGCSSGKRMTIKDNLIIHYIDTEKGQSGSPILVKNDKGN